MKLVSRYITTTIIASILIILLILMGLELLISFIGQLADIGSGNYGLLQALRFIALDMPYQMYNFIPMAGMIGSLTGLGVLANQSELIVMQASGFSKGQITLTVLQAAAIMAILALILGEFIAPVAENAANLGKLIAESGGQALHTQSGVWMRENNSFIYVGDIINPHQLRVVTRYQFNQHHQLQSVFTAKTADFHHHQWYLQDVKETYFLKNKTTSKIYPELRWSISINPNLLSVADDEPRNMSLLKLHEYIHYLTTNGLRSDAYELNYWKRIIQPIATLVMIFLAVPFVFGSLRTVPMGVRILTGVTVGFAFYILNEFFGPLSLLYQIPPVVGAVLPTTVFIFAGFFLLWRRR